MTNNPNSRKPTARELVAAKQVKVPTTCCEAATPAARPQTTAVAVPDHRPYREQYLDEVAPASIVGRMIKFSKEGKFVTHDDGKEVPEDAEFTCLAEETLIGWVKFNGDGEPPDRIMGLLYDGFVMPSEESLATRIRANGRSVLTVSRPILGKHHQYSCCKTPRRSNSSPL